MTFDTGGYRDRWCVPCTDLLGQSQRLVVAFGTDHRSLLLITPAGTVRLNNAQAGELAEDLRKAAGHLLPM
ncbi:MAG TPA: hypothetical protein VFW65_00485 [Pseudonocardiaceae bacterium]|nr:hypothetical protein [Pseudonocardiaceae bacterium]